MKIKITSRDAILTGSKSIAAEKGLGHINMREVAMRCHVAVGSVYNYFPSKNDLIIETIIQIWQEIFREGWICQPEKGFPKNVELLFQCMKKGSEKYPLFFVQHSVSLAKNGKDKGREAMNHYFENIKRDLLNCLVKDGKIKNDFFSERCSQKQFVDFVFSNIMDLLTRQADSCSILTEIIKGVIY